MICLINAIIAVFSALLVIPIVFKRFDRVRRSTGP